jgi:hypothetical protein
METCVSRCEIDWVPNHHERSVQRFQSLRLKQEGGMADSVLGSGQWAAADPTLD